jgi:hypothetical protein
MSNTESEVTARINWSRVFGCGLLAGSVWIIFGVLVTALPGRDFPALPGNRLASPTTDFVVLNLVLGSTHLIPRLPARCCEIPLHSLTRVEALLRYCLFSTFGYNSRPPKLHIHREALI